MRNIPFSVSKEDFTANRARSTSLKISFIAGFIGTYAIMLVLIFPVIYDVIRFIILDIFELLTITPPSGFSNPIAMDQFIYNNVLTVFGGIMLLTQFFCTFFPRLNINRKFLLLIGGAGAGVVLSVTGILYRNGSLSSLLGENHFLLEFFGNFWTTSDKANLVLPLIFLGIIGLIAEFVNIAMKEEKHLLRKTSQVMLHLSILVIMLGALMSSNMTTTSNIVAFDGSPPIPIPGTSLTFDVIDLERVFPPSGQHSVEYNTKFMISSSSRIFGLGVSTLYWDNAEARFGTPNRKGQDVTIITDLFTDIYVVTIAKDDSNPLQPIAVLIQIKIIPYINILWIGCILLHFAVIPLTIGRFIELKGVFSEKPDDYGDNYEDGVEGKPIVNNGGEVIE
jgi:hypothetical protein